MKIILIQFLLIYNLFLIYCYNISPVPNLVHTQNTSISKNKPNYFGLSLLLQNDRILVGAPRANSSLSNQKNITEPGVLYVCSVTSNDQPCTSITLKNEGNIKYGKDFDTEIRKNQWLGTSISGNIINEENGDNPFMVCAPLVKTDIYVRVSGICYIKKNYRNDSVIKYKQEISSDIKYGDSWLNLGFSSYWIKKKQTFLLGAPAFDANRGALAKYNLNNNKKELYYSTKLFKKDSYGGYSITSGILNKNDTISYILSGPRYSGVGIVIIINENNLNEKVRTLYGSQAYEYFGYSVISTDINGDGLSDIIVSAPFYSLKSLYEIGVIYIYNSINKYSKREIIISPSKFPYGRFGLSLSSLGDINLDGYNDIAVGAPYENNGKVYIYEGSSNSLNREPIQIFEAPKFFDEIASPTRHNFGFSISNGADIDGNGVNDIVISAINIDTIYLYKSYQTVTVDIFFEDLPEFIHYTKPNIEFKTCLRFISLKNQFNGTLKFNLILKLDRNDKRIKFAYDATETTNQIDVKQNEIKCNKHIVTIKHEEREKPFTFTLNYEHIQKNIGKDFCENCVIIHSKDKYKTITEALYIKHLCAGNRVCNSNLKVEIENSRRNILLLDEHRHLNVSFITRNLEGNDPAYLPRINITNNQNLPLYKQSPKCKNKDGILQCILSNDNNLVLNDNKPEILDLTFDISQLKGSELIINATVSSSSNEIDPNDNFASFTFEIVGCGDIEVIETSAHGSQFLNLYEGQTELFGFEKSFQVKNAGPSTLSNLNFQIQYPSILNLNSTDTIISPIEPYDEIFFKSDFNINFDETNRDIQDINEDDNDDHNEESVNFLNSRKKRNTDIAGQCIDSTDHLPSIYIDFIEKISSENKMVFDANMTSYTSLTVKSFVVDKLETSSGSILKIVIKFKVNQKKLWNLLEKYNKKYFIYKINFFVSSQRCTNDDCTPTTFVFRSKINEIIFYTIPIQKSAIWIYAVSIVFGLLFYFLIAFLFYKFGFFKRKKHEEVKDFKRQSIMRQSMRITAIPEGFDPDHLEALVEEEENVQEEGNVKEDSI